MLCSDICYSQLTFPRAHVPRGLLEAVPLSSAGEGGSPGALMGDLSSLVVSRVGLLGDSLS